MKKSILILLTLIPLIGQAENRRFVTSTATVWYLTFTDGTKKVVNYWTTGSRSKSTTDTEDEQYLIDILKEDYGSIFSIAPKSTTVDSVYVNYNEIECRYEGFDSFHTRSNSRTARYYNVDKDGNITFKREE